MAYRKKRDWPNDRRGHRKASKLGWKRRRRARRDMDPGRDWPNDRAGHIKAGKLAWKRRRRHSRAKFGAAKKRAGGQYMAFGQPYRRGPGRPPKMRDSDYSPKRRFGRRRRRY